ncbi:MAG: hypothetical protein U0V03_09520 [Bacteroidia bacterium]
MPPAPACQPLAVSGMTKKDNTQKKIFMTKILKLIILVHLTLSNCLACSCNYDRYKSFDFFKKIKYSLIGTVVKIEQHENENTFTFKVNQIFKGKLGAFVKVNSTKHASACGTYFELNKTYLVQLNKEGMKFHTSYCSFNAEKGSVEFMEDTMLLNLFCKKNTYVNLPNLQGQIKNGKQNGSWKESGDSGTYLNGKRNGVWKSSDTEIHYKNGKFVKMTEFVKDSILVKVITTNKQKTMYYTDGTVWKTMTKSKYVVFYPNGNIKETAKIKQGILIGQWIRYNKDGVIVKKIDGNDGAYDIGLWFYTTKEPKYFKD